MLTVHSQITAFTLIHGSKHRPSHRARLESVCLIDYVFAILHIKCKAEKSQTLYTNTGKIWFSEAELIKQKL